MKVNPSIVALFLLISLTGVFAFELGQKSLEIDALSSEVQALRTEVQSVSAVKSSVEALSSGMKLLQDRPQSQVSDDPISPAVFTAGKAHLDDPFLGDRNAPLLVMEFADFQSKPCREFANNSFQKLKSDFLEQKKVLFILRDFPLGKHPRARVAAALAHCAGEQAGYWKAFDALIKADFLADDANLSAAKKKLSFVDTKRLDKCLRTSRYDREIDLDLEEGRKLGVQGTPGFFVGIREAGGASDGSKNVSYRGMLIRGAQPYAVIRQEIEKLLPASKVG